MRIRRAIHKQKGNEVSIPVPKSNQKIKSEIKKLVDDGSYNLGIPVVDNEMVKLSVNKEGEVERKVMKVSARKIPFRDIREDALKSHKKFLRNNSDTYYQNLTKDDVVEQLHQINEDTSGDEEELKERLKMFQRQRHWLLWHDHSTLSNHGFMLFCLRELYDPAIHFTDAEILHKTNEAIDVQATIEEPLIYILGPSSSSIENQMKFIPTRQEDLKDLTNKVMTETGVPINDVMRFMNGDNPAIQFEDGKQHGGHYPCVGCDGNINSSYDLEYILQRKYKSLQEKREVVETGPAGKSDLLHPFKDLKVANIREELEARGVDPQGNKDELQKELAELLGGTVRKPALLHSGLTTKELNIDNYEVLYFEALHCSMNHIKNVLKELEHHITDIDTLILLKEILAVQLNKDKLRGVDYRKTLIYVTIALYKLASRDVKILLVTLCEMVEIFYMQDHKRTPKMILRLHNLCIRHAIQCRKVLTPPKSLTYRKLFGIYFHSCVSHSSFLLRLVSHRSTNAEMFERLFHKLSDITSKTWSRRIEDLSPNAILHAQVERECRPSNSIQKEEREISKIAASLPKMGNTVLPKSYIDEYVRDWNTHMETICDFLMLGEGVWWKETEDSCIEFFDGPDEPSYRPEGPSLHHFRSTTIPKEQTYLTRCWEACQKLPKLPTTKVFKNGKLQRTTSCCSIDNIDEEQDTPNNTEQVYDNIDEENDPLVDDFDEHSEEDDFMIDIRQQKDDFESEEIILDNCEVLQEANDECLAASPAKTAAADNSPDKSPSTPQNIGTKRAAHSSDTTRAILESEAPPAKKQRQDTELSTKTAKVLQKVLGSCPDVDKFDKLKQAVTANPSSRYNQERYEIQLAHVQVQTLKAYKQMSKELKEIENQKTEQYVNKSKKLRLASELLKSWKITVHLN